MTAPQVNIRPFRMAVDDAQIARLHERIRQTIWPARSWNHSDDWSYGMPEAYLRELADYWCTRFSWRAAVDKINAFPQFILRINDLDVHYIHARSPHPEATPLLLVHGWPGSIVEFLDVIPQLTHPEPFGGSAADAFHVICPSLPGYAFSEAPQARGMTPQRIAQQHAQLMESVGYSRFIAQGGDWGSVCCRHLPDICPERLVGLHLNLTLPLPPVGIAEPESILTEAERADLNQWNLVDRDISGYSHLQATRPQTLAYGLSDSPLGLAAWIGEKFHAWTDNQGDIRDAVSWDTLLTNISLYWFTNTIGSSVRLYRENLLAMGDSPAWGTWGSHCAVPTGIARYPAEHWKQPRSWAEREYNIVHWFEAPRGGHFAAMEQPDIFAADMRAFLARLRSI